MNTFVMKIHQWLDAPIRQHIETNVYEKRAVWAREIVLVIATLTTSLTMMDFRSWIPAIVAAIWSAIQCEDRRCIASVNTRHTEAGHEAPPLPPVKADIVAAAKAREPLFVWAWPLLSSLLAAGYARSISGALIVALVSGYIRAAWESKWFPAWRKSRLAWRQLRKVA